MAAHTRFKKVLGGIAAAVALTFVVAPAASAAQDDVKTVSSKPSPKKDSGWG